MVNEQCETRYHCHGLAVEVIRNGVQALLSFWNSPFPKAEYIHNEVRYAMQQVNPGILPANQSYLEVHCSIHCAKAMIVVIQEKN